MHSCLRGMGKMRSERERKNEMYYDFFNMQTNITHSAYHSFLALLIDATHSTNKQKM